MLAGSVMLFTDLSFWAFFAAVFLAYVVLPHKGQNRMLLVASYAFYAAWDWRFLSLILASTVIDYIVGLRLHAAQDDARRKQLLYVSLGANLGMLGVFKYFDFFADSFIAMLGAVGYEADPLLVSIILPVGISFFTFQTLSYTIDIYRRELVPERDFLNFALFVAFFPQLVAGPIERARNLLPNISQPRTLTSEMFARGVVLCLIGLIKKVVIADGIAPTVDAVYAAPDPARLDIIFATWLFAIQIYCDFSGYTDIARGVAKMLGFRLMVNFKQPYFATNPQEFWRRWHISLSTWLRDYLYVPLGGNRRGVAKTNRNLMATMVLGGLWHGAAWNFVLWGLYQGALLVLHRTLFGSGAALKGFVARIIGAALFFQVISYGWLLFRAESFAQINALTQTLISGGGISVMPEPPIAVFAGMLTILIWDLVAETRGRAVFYVRWPVPARAALWACLVYCLAFGATTSSTAFIYFQF
jgi:D-alanyl-lipoteichoic acid acyltransferase DltB (MBOAT superfamily)